MLDLAFGELELKPWEFWRLSWGEFNRMVRGYHRRVRYEQTNLGKLLFMIDTTKPRGKGQPRPKLDDYLPDKEEEKPITEEERKARAEKVLKAVARFEKGGVKIEKYG